MDVVYGCYLTLATYFEQSGDISFSNHFYKLCLEASMKVRGDGRRKEAEANFNMGVAYEKQGLIVNSWFVYNCNSHLDVQSPAK